MPSAAIKTDKTKSSTAFSELKIKNQQFKKLIKQALQEFLMVC
ncbi:hypothetical protein [Anabaena catenula]|nr:hypothetical protein [Anabaena catenula]